MDHKTDTMKSLKILFILILIVPDLSGQSISDYVTFYGYAPHKDFSKEVIVIRKFSMDNRTYCFVVSPGSLRTEILPSDSIKVFQASWNVIRTRYATTPYIKALQQARTHSDTLQDAGITRFMPSQKGFDLTVDLCPSKLPMDRIVFTDLINEVGRVEKPVPVAISITGRWINAHPDDLSWLKELERTGQLSIVWINHTYNHFTERNVPLTKNFMLTPGTDISAEVLNTEIALLQRNIVPSIFFRFPGLVSDQDIYDKILDFGLIPVGSDAWLAKGQWPVTGSIVLIHANGNEPVGIRDFIDLLQKDQTEILSKSWELFDLRVSLVDTESK
jgi:hypothetical protein